MYFNFTCNNPVLFYLSPRIGFIENKKSFLFVYPLTNFIILILGPFVFGYFLWPDYLFWVRVMKPMSAFDTAYFLSCLIIYFLALFFYSKRTKTVLGDIIGCPLKYD
jgi:hypothetical protein